MTAAEYPGVSCVCVTFGRPRLLEEAIWSFLQQDYPGPKELLVLNDLALQTLRLDHPEVVVVNVPRRFRTIGEKRNAAVALCRYDLLAVWDDDDISLPHRLRYSVDHYDETLRFFKPCKVFVASHGEITGIGSRTHCPSIFHRSLHEDVSGYPPCDSGEDRVIDLRFKKLWGRWPIFAIEDADIFYLYRWSGSGSYHLTGSGGDLVGRFVLDRIRRGDIAGGEIELEPGWSRDWTKLAEEYVALQQG